MTDIPKAYEPRGTEDRWCEFWNSRGYFKPRGEGAPYCITIPPPNVTGSLHIGHALCYTIQDCLIRWKRMQGYDTLCVPGTDHAGIATQNVVEKQIRKEGLTRHDLGRERFIERVWDWVHQYGGVILSQLKTLGCSFDWDRTRFTMDEKYVEAVLEEFVRWWDEGHIYRGKRVINWCPRCLTAISDIEVEHTDRAGKLYHIKYPFKDGSGHVFVATTRPETMLGDTAAVANPTDERYKDLFGRTILLPLVGREIPFLADEYASPEFGTGVVKVTPAHDPNDFEVGLRHNLEKIVVIDEQGKMSADAGARYAGLDRFEARKLVVEDLEAQGFLQKADDYTIPTATCERCHTVIEPLLSEQWFVRMSELAKPAIEAVRDGRISFVPERYKRVYLDWMENIKDWCISRQLWFGHRIPVWKTDDGEYIVARSEQEAVSKAGGRVIVQDEDVLDTWFSSALWPHAVLGWPDKTPDLDRYYPTSVLVTAREIIYLWVARMIMTGFDFMGEIPYSSVYVYATVLNEEGRRMSKSLGTGVDPLDLIAIYGTDALRFSLLVRTAKGQDIRFAGMKEGKQKQVEEARNFANKIWNAARFVLMNVEKSSGIEAKWVPSDALADRWILSELDLTIRQVNEALEDYRINDVGQTLYHFFWDDFCDWYIELSKALVASSEDTQEVRNARGRILYVLESSLRLLHPLMPFITEDIWQRLPHSGESIMIAPFPQAREGADDEEARAEMATLINVITRIRNIRSEFNVPNSSRIAVHLSSDDAGARALIQSNLDYIERLARVHVVSSGESIPQLDNAARDIVSGIEIAVPLEGLIDVTKERERLSREVNRKENEASGLATRLQNESFVDKAPAEVVEQARLRHSELLVDIEKLRSTLRSLG
ncbi:MAG: valine--tRNA ligase [Blastocatellia bacterium AA13]|nr:MAG: valine--tRNA ligase [Blastocatellia bacterium AA13]